MASPSIKTTSNCSSRSSAAFAAEYEYVPACGLAISALDVAHDGQRWYAHPSAPPLQRKAEPAYPAPKLVPHLSQTLSATVGSPWGGRLPFFGCPPPPPPPCCRALASVEDTRFPSVATNTVPCRFWRTMSCPNGHRRRWDAQSGHALSDGHWSDGFRRQTARARWRTASRYATMCCSYCSWIRFLMYRDLDQMPLPGASASRCRQTFALARVPLRCSAAFFVRPTSRSHDSFSLATRSLMSLGSGLRSKLRRVVDRGRRRETEGDGGRHWEFTAGCIQSV